MKFLVGGLIAIEEPVLHIQKGSVKDKAKLMHEKTYEISILHEFLIMNMGGCRMWIL